MSSMFWIPTDKLDEQQREATQTIPESTSFLLKGPAGSGKTNILLLRAKLLTLKKRTNFKIIVFTASLRDFVEEGCRHYGIDPSSAVTQMRFFQDVLREYSVEFELTKDFVTDRTMLAGKILALIEEKNISNSYCGTLLVDESQDYSDTELRVFKGLTKCLVLAADSRQSIYNITHTPGLMEKLVDDNVVELRYHYRSGLKLCKVADAILADAAKYPRMQGQCYYPEADKPSSVESVPLGSFEDQMGAIVANLKSQLDLYPNERIGVLFPKTEQVAEFKKYFSSSSVNDPDGVIRVDTMHGGKGWEFRAVHLGGCEVLPKMGATQKRLIYTGVLRGKTSVHIYYTGRIPGYLVEALAVLEPPPADPSMEDLLRGY